MGQERVFKILTSLELSKSDIRVYIFLAKNGPKVGRDHSEALNMGHAKLYQSLRNLRQKNLVRITSERGALFLAVPFDKVIDSAARSRLREAKQYKLERDFLTKES